MSLKAVNSADAHPEALIVERADEPITRVSPDLIEERIKVNSEPLNDEISMLTQLVNQLIQENSARSSPTAGPRNHRTKSGLSPSGACGSLERRQEKQLGVQDFHLTGL